MTRILSVLTIVAMVMLSACGTTDAALLKQGASESYIQGFHDGRHSGMSEEGNRYEHYIKDASRFDADEDYRRGWEAGETEGKQLQDQAMAVGEAAAGAYSGVKIGKEVDRHTDADGIARDAIKGVDTTDLKNLGK